MTRSRPWLGGGDFGTSLAFVVPLLIAYEVGVLFAEHLNGVDMMTRGLLRLVGGDVGTYLLVHAGIAAVYLGTVLYLRHQRRLDGGAFVPMLLESAIYALTLGSLIVFVMENLFGLGRALAIGSTPFHLGHAGSVLVTALGAGVHEELVFRLVLFGGGALLLGKLGVTNRLAVILALVASSVLFSAAHHLGPLGEPFDVGVFLYRTLAGLVFGAIFYFRSFAHAVYTHFLYDLYVLTLRS